jgi:hypothetical protein
VIVMRGIKIDAPDREMLGRLLDSDERIRYVGVADPERGDEVRAKVMEKFTRVFSAGLSKAGGSPGKVIITDGNKLHSERTYGWCTYGSGTDTNHDGKVLPGSGVLSVVQDVLREDCARDPALKPTLGLEPVLVSVGPGIRVKYSDFNQSDMWGKEVPNATHWLSHVDGSEMLFAREGIPKEGTEYLECPFVISGYSMADALVGPKVPVAYASMAKFEDGNLQWGSAVNQPLIEMQIVARAGLKKMSKYSEAGEQPGMIFPALLVFGSEKLERGEVRSSQTRAPRGPADRVYILDRISAEGNIGYAAGCWPRIPRDISVRHIPVESYFVVRS